MNGTIPLILAEENLRWIRFRSLYTSSPHVVIVCADAAGDPVAVNGRRLHAWDHVFPKWFRGFRKRYEVDGSNHRLEVHLRDIPLPSKDDAHDFEATVYGSLRVMDPVAVVRRNVGDGLPIVSDYLVNTMRKITRRFDVADITWAEQAVNNEFTEDKALPEGIAVSSCRASLRLDANLRDYRDAMVKAERDCLLNDKQHSLNVAKAERNAQVEEISQSAKIDNQARAIHALGNQKLTPRQLIGLYLQSHPKDGARALELLVQYEEGRGSRQDARQDKWLDLIRDIVLRNPDQAADIDRLEEMMGRLWVPPASVRERNSTDVVLPVYLVVDESDATALDELNVGMKSLQLGLVGETEAAAAIRLCVIGFAGDVQVRMEPRALARQGPITTFKTHRGGGQAVAKYGPVFRALFERLPRDVGKLWSEGLRVHRPVVFFLTAQPPMDRSTWHVSHAQLVDRSTRWYAPHIVVYGVGGTDGETRKQDIGRIATQPDFAFFAPGDSATAIRNAFTAIQRSVVKSGHAFFEDRITLVVSRPRDFGLALESTGASTQPAP
jgi:uncharacterized protein YegL